MPEAVTPRRGALPRRLISHHVRIKTLDNTSKNAPAGAVRAAAHNLFWLAAERLTQLGVAIAVSGILARYLGADLFGKWQYANTLLTVVAPLTWICGAEILVPAIVTTLHGTHPAKRTDTSHPAGNARHRADTDVGPAPLGHILGSAFALRFGVSTAALLLTWAVLAALVLEPVSTRRVDAHVAAMLAGLAATMLFREPFGVISTWLQARTYSKPALLLSLVSAIAKTLLLVVLVRLAVPAGALGWLWALESAVIAAGLLAYYRGYWRRQHGPGSTPGSAPDSRPNTSDAQRAAARWRVDPGLLRVYLRTGAVFWVGLVCMYLFMKLDRLVLQQYADYATLGRYAASQQLTENWVTVALMLAQTVGPAFIYRAHDAATLQRNLWRLLGLTLIAMSIGAAVLSAAAPWIVRIVFGPGFDEAARYLAWASWIGVLAGLEAVANLVALKFQARGLVLGKWLAAMVLAFVVDLALVPRHGGYGALAGLAAGYLAALAADLVFARTAIRRMRATQADGWHHGAAQAGRTHDPGGTRDAAARHGQNDKDTSKTR